VDVGVLFDDAVIADVNRNEYHVLTGTVTVGIEQDGDQAQFGHEQFSGSAPATFDEQFDIEPFLQQLVDIG